MQKTYSVKSVALTIGVDIKWLDNLLSHFHVVGVDKSGRGLERRLNGVAVTAVAICRLLSFELGVALGKAVAIANVAVTSREGDDAQYRAAPGLTVHFSLDEIDRQLQSRLADAVEAVAHVRRGRPPKRSRTE